METRISRGSYFPGNDVNISLSTLFRKIVKITQKSQLLEYFSNFLYYILDGEHKSKTLITKRASYLAKQNFLADLSLHRG